MAGCRMRYMEMAESKILTCGTEKLPEAMNFLREALKKKKAASKDIARALLASEEVIAKLISNAPDSREELKLSVSGMLGNIRITFRAKGAPFEAADIERDLLFEQDDEEANNALRYLINKILGNDLEIKNNNNINMVVLSVKKSHYISLIYTAAALTLGLLTGFFLKNAFPGELSQWINSNLLIPVYTIFMNTLKFIVAPLVFFSIASSIADFGDIRFFGRIALRVVLLYVTTSAIAVGAGYLAYSLFPIGDRSLEAAVSAEDAEAALEKGREVQVSVKDTLVGVVPTDIVTPFQKSYMLQIIFAAVLIGLASSALSEKYPLARKCLSTFDALSSRITAAIVSFMPLVVFCSMAKMMISMEIRDILNIFLWVPVIYLGNILMLLIYILMLLVTGLNPVKFFGKYYPAMVSAFTLGSSSAALPSSIKQCDEMGISPRVYSFALPMGTTINLDGSCITLMITSLFFARIFNVSITGSILLSLFIAIIVVTLGSPGVPGGNIVCIALLVPQIGIPAESISLIMGLYPLVGMIQTCSNVTGDAVVTAIAAKHTKLMDMEKFNS